MAKGQKHETKTKDKNEKNGKHSPNQDFHTHFRECGQRTKTRNENERQKRKERKTFTKPGLSHPFQGVWPKDKNTKRKRKTKTKRTENIHQTRTFTPISGSVGKGQKHETKTKDKNEKNGKHSPNQDFHTHFRECGQRNYAMPTYVHAKAEKIAVPIQPCHPHTLIGLPTPQ